MRLPRNRLRRTPRRCLLDFIVHHTLDFLLLAPRHCLLCACIHVIVSVCVSECEGVCLCVMHVCELLCGGQRRHSSITQTLLSSHGVSYRAWSSGFQLGWLVGWLATSYFYPACRHQSFLAFWGPLGIWIQVWIVVHWVLKTILHFAVLSKSFSIRGTPWSSFLGLSPHVQC